ncbi:DUF6250 domain-containing protein [Sphingopyxis sp. MWB1]|uniref:DUF6250 domain-containing protein n=1 Tax=Sphingopyxis sp. MWB1 TaxID=1537715 RepID=UPI00051A3FB2|nr:DUF6250 domain-containing protein [Sphingopyxis sp. MWB1]
MSLAAGLLSACAVSVSHRSDGFARPEAWTVEAENPAATVSFSGGTVDIDTPQGLTLWLKQPLVAPVEISFDAMAVSEGGDNDHVSDLNAFWMASNKDGSDVLSRPRSGAFAEYDDMRAYYVGIGGNRNSTTRFRRYVGESGNRPLLPAHDLSDPVHMLKPNVWTHIALKVEAEGVTVHRDGRVLFRLADPAPYGQGHFGLRTTKSHLRFRNLTVK